MYRLCIFDLDGTLLNTVYALTYVTNLTLDAFGLRHVTPEETKRIVGNGYRMQMKRALVLAGDEKLVHYEASLPIYMENFSKYCLKDVEPYDGIRELLASLKEVGVHVAVPYILNCKDALNKGKNTIRIEVTNLPVASWVLLQPLALSGCILAAYVSATATSSESVPSGNIVKLHNVRMP